MHMIIAYVQSFMAKDVVHALHQVKGVTGATFTEVRGFGSARRNDTPVPEVIYGTAEKTRVEVVVRNSLVTAVVEAIRTSARTGQRGDGKIFVLPVSRGVKIATGAESDGDEAL
ncbi:MAG: P-II family nitrogen regulator [Gemmatimonadota bacterium]